MCDILCDIAVMVRRGRLVVNSVCEDGDPSMLEMLPSDAFPVSPWMTSTVVRPVVHFFEL